MSKLSSSVRNGCPNHVQHVRNVLCHLHIRGARIFPDAIAETKGNASKQKTRSDGQKISILNKPEKKQKAMKRGTVEEEGVKGQGKPSLAHGQNEEPHAQDTALFGQGLDNEALGEHRKMAKRWYE